MVMETNAPGDSHLYSGGLSNFKDAGTGAGTGWFIRLTVCIFTLTACLCILFSLVQLSLLRSACISVSWLFSLVQIAVTWG